jgi:hypothetical protein
MSPRPDAETLYVALIGAPERLRRLRRLTYWCNREERCLLLDAVAVGEAILLHQKRFKFSEAVNEQRSNEAGRARNTYDGRDHWMPSTYWLEQSALALLDEPKSKLEVQCDHVGPLPGGGHVHLTALGFHDDWHAGHSEVRVRADGTRFPVR